MTAVTMTFTFENMGEAADFLALLNGDVTPVDTPDVAASEPKAERPPWEPDPEQATGRAQSDSKAPETDPWGDDPAGTSEPSEAVSEPSGDTPDPDDPWS